ncbi:very short patch repair endonuclease [Rhizobium laguerreae]
MVDRISPERRSQNMARIKGHNTAPELRVRKLLHRLGYRFRLHSKDLPGTPDIVLAKHRSVIFVHGCFWHRHPGCRLSYMPKSRLDFWSKKFQANVKRDQEAIDLLQSVGWRVLVLWECETKDDRVTEKAIHQFLSGCFNEKRAID